MRCLFILCMFTTVVLLVLNVQCKIFAYCDVIQGNQFLWLDNSLQSTTIVVTTAQYTYNNNNGSNNINNKSNNSRNLN